MEVASICPCACLGPRTFFVEMKGVVVMETRIALMGIVVENKDSTRKLNDILHEYGEYVIGRMGIPYPKRNIAVISIVLDAPNDIISALSGKLGMIPQVNIKTVYSKTSSPPEE